MKKLIVALALVCSLIAPVRAIEIDIPKATAIVGGLLICGIGISAMCRNDSSSAICGAICAVGGFEMVRFTVRF